MSSYIYVSYLERHVGASGLCRHGPTIVAWRRKASHTQAWL